MDLPFIKKPFESNNKEVLETFLDKYQGIPHFTRPILMEQFLSADDFFAGDSELISMRKELLERLVTKPAAEKWYKQYEQGMWTFETDNLSAFDSIGYHPDDKNFNYYRRHTGRHFMGCWESQFKTQPLRHLCGHQSRRQDHSNYRIRR